VTLAIRPVNGGQALYTITPTLPAAFYREVARFAGVHLYNDRDDTLYASRSYLTLAANQAGPRTLRLPQPCDVFDPFTGARLYENVSEFTRSFLPGETVLFRLERRG
jgi:hypothetical protein